MSSVAAAAAAVGLVFFVSADGDGTPSGAGDVQVASVQTGENLTSPDKEMEQIQRAVEEIQQSAERGQPADTDLLRTVALNTAAVADTIANKPATVSRQAVETYLDTVERASNVLRGVQTADNGAGTLVVLAQAAAEDGRVTASAFLRGETPTSTPSPTATPTPTPTAEPTETPTPSPTPSPTPTVEPTATATPEPTSTPEATSTPPAGGATETAELEATARP
jgi:hypothetical protein